jgi:uncharacterized membrane protein
MNRFQVAIPAQPQSGTSTVFSASHIEIISLYLLVFLGLPLIAMLFKRRKRRHEAQIETQHQMLERIWKAKSGKPQI